MPKPTALDTSLVGGEDLDEDEAELHWGLCQNFLFLICIVCGLSISSDIPLRADTPRNLEFKKVRASSQCKTCRESVTSHSPFMPSLPCAPRCTHARVHARTHTAQTNKSSGIHACRINTCTTCRCSTAANLRHKSGRKRRVRQIRLRHGR